MDLASLHVSAGFVSEDFFRAHPELRAGALEQELAALVETALRSVARQQAELCAAVCDERHRLWLSSERDDRTPVSLRHEARARANEAAYLADAMRAS